MWVSFAVFFFKIPRAAFAALLRYPFSIWKNLFSYSFFLFSFQTSPESVFLLILLFVKHFFKRFLFQTSYDVWKVHSKKVFLSKYFCICTDHRIFGSLSKTLFSLSPKQFSILLYSISLKPWILRAVCVFLTAPCILIHKLCKKLKMHQNFSLERRWSSRTFRYGYLVTTSP